MDRNRIVLFAISLLSSSYIGWQFAGEFAKCEKAPEILINIFSILMSVMLAVMTLSADFRKSISQTASLISYEDKLSSLTRLIFLFSIYVLVLIGSFVLILMENSKPIILSGIVLGMASFAMIMSLKMPFVIYANLKNANPDNDEA